MMRPWTATPRCRGDRSGAASARPTSSPRSTSTRPLPTTGPRGAILRREGLYSSHITEWRRARDAGALEGLAPKSRPRATSPGQVELARLRRRLARAEAELAKARLVIDIQGKASELLGRLLAESDEGPRQPR